MRTLGPKEIDYIRLGRHKARTDLLWLCRHILGMDKIVEHVHRPMANFLQRFDRYQGRDEVGRLEPERLYTPLDPDPVKVLPGFRRRLLLAPRGWFKTSVNVIGHSIQSLLNFPDATILLVHASQEMAEQMLLKIKEAFQANNEMRYFFPEFCPPPRKEWGTQQFFNLPNRQVRTISPTMQVAGIETIRTGMHYHIVKFTDVVDEKNSATKDQCEKIVARYGMSRNLLISPLYWIDLEGTRYDFSDLYGRIIDDWLKEDQSGVPDDRKKFQCFVMGCYQTDLKGEPEKFTPNELGAPFVLDGIGGKISRFPEEFPADKLEEMRQDPIVPEHIFHSQQLNNPVGTDNVAFPLEYLRWKTPEEISRIPIQYYITTVDLAETTGKRSDYTCITTAAVDRMNRRTVVDVRLGKFLPDEIVDHIFGVQAKYRPIKVKVEETGFTLGLLPTIRRRSETTGIWPNFEFLRRDNQSTKAERIMCLQPWYKNGLIYFSTELSDHAKDQLKHELTRFPKYVHDDILDTLADQFQNEPVYGPVKESPSMAQTLQNAHDTMLRRLHEYNTIFGKKEPTGTWTGLGAL